MPSFFLHTAFRIGPLSFSQNCPSLVPQTCPTPSSHRTIETFYSLQLSPGKSILIFNSPFNSHSSKDAYITLYVLLIDLKNFQNYNYTLALSHILKTRVHNVVQSCYWVQLSRINLCYSIPSVEWNYFLNKKISNTEIFL